MARRKYFRLEFFWTAAIIQLAMFTTAANVTTVSPQTEPPEELTGYAWSSWGSWSRCSKTCGGGVAVQERQCLPRSKLIPEGTLPPPVITVRVTRQAQECAGVARRYHECNTAPCPGGQKDMRAEQCASYDRRPFRGRFYTWLPYIDGDRPCLLNCRPLGQHFYASLALVADGTPCTRPGFRAICVQGTCKVVGRETVLAVMGSSPELRCGRRLVSGLFSRPRLPLGYSYVTTVPLGACRLNISAILPSDNYIALKISNGSYIINGEFAVSAPGVYDAAGARFRYTRVNRIDSIFAVGPVYFPIDIMILSSQPNPTIRYEYFTEYLPGEAEKEPTTGPNVLPEIPIIYPTAPTNLNNRRVNYFEPYPNNPISPKYHEPPSYQDPLRYPESPRYQGTPPYQETPRHETPRYHDTPGHRETPRYPELPQYPEKFSSSREESDDDGIQENVIGGRRFIWKILHYTQCSHTCGGGIQVGRYRCVELRSNFEKEVSSAHCMGDPPANRKRKCGNIQCPPRWRAASWSTCPKCGPAFKTRIVGCVQDHSKGITKVSDQKCPQPKPPTSEPCNIPDCTDNKAVMFVTSKRGIRTKDGDMTDSFHDGPVFSMASNHTDIDMGPEYSFSPAAGWLSTNWSECVGWCVGGGVRTRGIHCADPSGCAPRRPPEDTEKCHPQLVCEAHDGEWFTGDWSPCTHACEGKQVRGAICIGGTGRRLRDAACKAPRPETTRDCGGLCHPTWYSSDWGMCEENCSTNTGIQRRTVWCATRDGASHESKCRGERPASTMPCTPKCDLFTVAPKPRVPNVPTPFKAQEEKPEEKVPDLPKEIPESPLIEKVHYETSTVTTKQMFSGEIPAPSPGAPYIGGCVDKLNNCALAVQARLCNYNYYRQMCCVSCGGR